MELATQVKTAWSFTSTPKVVIVSLYLNDTRTSLLLCFISGFRSGVNEFYALLGFYEV